MDTRAFNMNQGKTSFTGIFGRAVDQENWSLGNRRSIMDLNKPMYFGISTFMRKDQDMLKIADVNYRTTEHANSSSKPRKRQSRGKSSNRKTSKRNISKGNGKSEEVTKKSSKKGTKKSSKKGKSKEGKKKSSKKAKSGQKKSGSKKKTSGKKGSKKRKSSSKKKSKGRKKRNNHAGPDPHLLLFDD